MSMMQMLLFFPSMIPNAVALCEKFRAHLSSVVRYISAADKEQEQVRPNECSKDAEISPSIVEGET